jgi:hypothetical protein
MKDQWLDRKYILTGAMNMFCETRRIIIVQPCRLAVTRALPELNYQQLRRCRRPNAISLSPLDNAKAQSLEQGIEKKTSASKNATRRGNAIAMKKKPCRLMMRRKDVMSALRGVSRNIISQEKIDGVMAIGRTESHVVQCPMPLKTSMAVHKTNGRQLSP